jgi:hypothetical protein
VKWAALVIAVVGVLTLLDMDGEMHYRNCISKIEAKDPLVFSEKGASLYDARPQFISVQPRPFREAAIAHCSHWPW